MGLVTIFMWLVAAALTGIVLLLLYKSEENRRYFKRKGVPYIGIGVGRTLRFLAGKLSILDTELMLAKDAEEAAAKANSPIVGMSDLFLSKGFYVTDLDLARNVYVKDFDPYFVNRRKFETQKSDLLLKKMLSLLEGEHWKMIRSKLSPTFTTGKIRRMFGIFEKSSQRMCDFLKENTANSEDFDISDAYSKYAMDVISSCAFGVESKTFENQAGVVSEFEDMIQRFQLKFKPSVLLKFIIIIAAPKLADMLGIHALDLEPQLYFMRIIKAVMKHRRETGERQDDFLQLMMDAQKGLLKNEEQSKEVLEVMTGVSDDAGNATSKHFQTSDAEQAGKYSFDDDDIVANCVIFFSAGYDTTQSFLLLAAYQLALEQEVQERLYKDVASAIEKSGGKMVYESLHEMSYLDLFVNETLRCFPPATRTERLCSKDYLVPGTNVVIEKGVIVTMPVIGAHRNPKYYENPEKFDPERFLPERKSGRHPYAFSPFGHGPRNCIGMRFAMTKAKAAIANLVYNFHLEPSSRTEIPMKFGNSPILKPKNGLRLKFTSRRAGREE